MACEVTELKHVRSLEDVEAYDCVVVIGEGVEGASYPDFFDTFLHEVKQLKQCDASGDITIAIKGNKLVIWSPTGPLDRDYDDVRRYKDAAIKGINRALKAKKKAPVIVISNGNHNRRQDEYQDSVLVSLLGALEAVYVPIEVREALPDKNCKVSRLGFASTQLQNNEQVEKLIADVMGLEYGRIITRDIGGSDPERMAPPNVESYLRETFNGTCIKMNVIAGHTSFVKDYPLFAAVDRCADKVHRHQGRIIYLEYTGEDVTSTHMFVGKGVTYDTGGADVKAGGVMAGMHRDNAELLL